MLTVNYAINVTLHPKFRILKKTSQRTAQSLISIDSCINEPPPKFLPKARHCRLQQLQQALNTPLRQLNISIVARRGG